MYKHLLVPVDDASVALGLLDNAVAYARASAARLTFFHATPDLAATGSGAMLLAADPQAFLASARAPGMALLAKAEAAARAEHLCCDSALVVNDHVAEAILDTCARLGCDLILLATRGRSRLGQTLSGSVTRQLIAAARVPVLVTCTDPQLRQSARFRAVSLIRNEHRSLAAVLRGLEHLAHRWHADQLAPDFRLLGAMLYYIEHFPERLHHPKEEQQIFARLEQRTAEHATLLAELRAQHQAGTAQLQALQARLVEFEAGGTEAGGRFFEQAQTFIAAQWHHMSTEERLVLPAAEALLSTQDWEAVALAFDGQADPQFRHDAEAPFDKLFARIAQLAAEAITTRA